MMRSFSSLSANLVLLEMAQDRSCSEEEVEPRMEQMVDLAMVVSREDQQREIED